jgi:hypothetical protein
MLHGDVRINDIVIGEYKATNIGVTDGHARYDCWISYRGLDGYMYEAKWQIWGVFKGNGAISLASRVLREGMTKAKRVYPNTDAEAVIGVKLR